MKTWTEKDIEKLLRGISFPNPAHKKALKKRLFEEKMALGPDDLELAAGGSAIEEKHFLKRSRIMENKNMDEVMRKLFSGESMELDLEDLAGVAGGKMTQSDIATLDSVLKMAKNGGLSLKEVLGYVDQYYLMYHKMYPHVTKEEVITYIKQHWNSL